MKAVPPPPTAPRLAGGPRGGSLFVRQTVRPADVIASIYLYIYTYTQIEFPHRMLPNFRDVGVNRRVLDLNPGGVPTAFFTL